MDDPKATLETLRTITQAFYDGSCSPITHDPKDIEERILNTNNQVRDIVKISNAVITLTLGGDRLEITETTRKPDIRTFFEAFVTARAIHIPNGHLSVYYPHFSDEGFLAGYSHYQISTDILISLQDRLIQLLTESKYNVNNIQLELSENSQPYEFLKAGELVEKYSLLLQRLKIKSNPFNILQLKGLNTFPGMITTEAGEAIIRQYNDLLTDPLMRVAANLYSK